MGSASPNRGSPAAQGPRSTIGSNAPNPRQSLPARQPQSPALTNRPNIGNTPDRPNISRPNLGDNINRPDLGDRPNFGDNVGNRLDAGNRLEGRDGNRINDALNDANRTTVNRPDALGNRLGNNANINNNLNARLGTAGGLNAGFTNAPQHWNPYQYSGWNRSFWNLGGYGLGYNRYGYGYGYGGGLYGGGYYNPWYGYGWYGRPWGRWAALGLSPWGLGGQYYNLGYSGYYNPYYSGGAGYIYDYAQPLAYIISDTDGPLTPSDEVAAYFAAAREAFLAEDYAAALAEVDQAVSRSPDDPSLHEFRALTLFALQRYPEAAAAAYAVLAVGPGMSWSSLTALYPSVSVYTPQMRALEVYARENPQEADAQFLLGYHYMTLGHLDAARKRFEKASALSPKDIVSHQMVRLLTPQESPATEENPALPPGPAAALPPATRPTGPQATSTAPALRELTGDFRASAGRDGSIGLSLREDGAFTWRFTQGDKPKEFQGKYTLEGNTLALEFEDGGGMVGTVEPKQDGFHFAILNGPEKDPGLDFARR